MKTDIWGRMIRRYAIGSGVGLVTCIILFWRLESIPAGQVVPVWMVDGAALGGVLLLGGLFGVAVSFFFSMWSEERR